MGVGKSKPKRTDSGFFDRVSLETNENKAPSSPFRKMEMKARRHTLVESHKMFALESLDFRVPDDLPTRTFLSDPETSKRDKQKLIAKWIIYFFIGLVTGVVAWSIKNATELLQEWKEHAIEIYSSQSGTGNHVIAFFVYYSINLAYALAACIIVLLCGPLAGGSGIPEVKGYLNGVRVEGVTNIKTFIGKVVSIIFGFSSCLTLGPEGPMVHIGSMIGGGLSAGKSKTLHIRLPKMFERIRSDREQRDFISSGTAAGIAAAFGAPIGGVLFSLEETSSFWSRELTWRTFFGSMVAAFTVNALNAITKTHKPLVGDYGLLSFGISRFYSYRYEELAAFCVIGFIGGLLGALFVKLNVALNKWRRDFLHKNRILKLLEVVVVVTLTAVLAFGLSGFGACHDIESTHVFPIEPSVCEGNSTQTFEPIRLFCPEGQYNDFANLFLIPQDVALRFLLSRKDEYFGFAALGTFLPVYFCLVCVTAGLSVAGGLFVPMMLMGATYGRIFGKILALIVPQSSYAVDASIYALVGAGAMMSGFSRTTISLVVIMIELTANTQYLLPIMLAIMCAKGVGDIFGHAIYEELMELKSITFLDHHPPRDYMAKPIEETMNKDVICINEVESLSRIVDLLKSTTHNGFPVVRKSSEDKAYTYRGFILRKQLLILISSKRFHLKDGMNPEVLDYENYIGLLNRKWKMDDSLNLPGELNKFVLDVGPYMDRSHPIVQKISSFLDSYRLFQTLGLRHLPVVDDEFQVVGIVTRHDLLDYWITEKHDSIHLGLETGI